MQIFPEISEGEFDSLQAFKNEHESCWKQGKTVEVVPGDHYVYTYIPTSWGRYIKVACACGASFEISDFV